MSLQIFSRKKLQWRLEHFQQELEAVQKSGLAATLSWTDYMTEEIEQMRKALKTDKQTFEVDNGYLKI